MNLWLPVILIVFHVNIITAGLSPAERKALEDAINKDRAEVGKKYNIEYPRLTYDEKLEKELDSMGSCVGEHVAIVKGNSDLRKILEGFPTSPLFITAAYEFGCSKTIKCSDLLKGQDIGGKTPEIYAACLIRKPKNVDSNLREKLAKAEYPSPLKYGDLIGSDSNSSGKVLNFIFSLFFVFYV